MPDNHYDPDQPRDKNGEWTKIINGLDISQEAKQKIKEKIEEESGEEKSYVARYSGHIQEDIKRNWSSWNFGEEGLHATESQIEAWKQDAIDNDKPFYISGFELWGDDIKNADIRELYKGYWVLVDNTNGHGDGIFGVSLKSKNLSQAISESAKADYSGEGTRFDATEAKLVRSIGNIHIFEVE